MNQCYFSYCLKMGCGGIHLKYKNIKVMKHISFLLDDTTRPGVVFDLEGRLLHVNNSFCEEFVNDGKENIKQFFINPIVNLWDDIISNIKETENKTVEVNIRLVENRVDMLKCILSILMMFNR